MLQRIDLSELSNHDCVKLLKKKGFFQKRDASSTVPIEYLHGPYIPVEIDEDELDAAMLSKKFRQEL